MSCKQSSGLDARRFVLCSCSCWGYELISLCPGSSGDNIVSHFAVYYHNEASRLGIDLNELYSALVTDGEVNPPEWNIQGRQVNVYKWVVFLTFPPPDGKWYLRQYGYVPFAVLDVSSTGRQTREGSRTLEVGGEGIFLLKTLPSSLTLFHKYAFEDFGIRQVAQLLGKADDVAKYTQRSLVRSSSVYPFLFSWQDLVISQCLGSFCSQRRLQRCEWHGPFCFRILKFDSGFAQKRYSNGTFFYTDPIDCSSNDKDNTRECSLQGDNVVGFYESSSWEYSWYVHQPELTMAVWTITLRYAPHDTAHLIELMGGNVSVAVLKNVRYVGLTRQLGNLCQSTWPLLQCQPLFLSTIPHGTDYTRLDIIFLETNRLSKCVLLLL